ncbi:uncharacterized protein DS421_15g495880 [Arachis hypogaea]|nr:uncharacterized protein DS421_15g495880 [Arachis hypogaea]
MITLEDVAMILGLRSDGMPVSGLMISSQSLLMDEGMDQFGSAPTGKDCRKSFIKLMWLRRYKNSIDLTDVFAIQRYVKAHIMMLFGTILFFDKSGTGVHWKFLPLLREFHRIREFSWGSACLAHLYRSLCRASRFDCKDIDGPVLLLQIWAWKRMSFLAPVPRTPRFPLACRWVDWILLSNDYRIWTTRWFRELLDTMDDIVRFVWDLYNEDRISPHLVSADIRHDGLCWNATVSLISFEYHLLLATVNTPGVQPVHTPPQSQVHPQQEVQQGLEVSSYNQDGVQRWFIPEEDQAALNQIWRFLDDTDQSHWGSYPSQSQILQPQYERPFEVMSGRMSLDSTLDIPSMSCHSWDPSGGRFSFDSGRSGLGRGVEFVGPVGPSGSIPRFDLNTVAATIQEKVEAEDEELEADAFIRTVVNAPRDRMDDSDDEDADDDDDNTDEDEDDDDNDGVVEDACTHATDAGCAQDKGYDLRNDPLRRSRNRYTPATIKKNVGRKIKSMAKAVKNKFSK